MKKTIILLLCICSLSLFSQTRNTVNIPDILDYKTLKGDLHIHTIFSDGRVWPDIRVEEAWRDGLDFIAITDHINYKGPVLKKHLSYDDKNAHYDEAIHIAHSMGISLIRAVEYNAPGNIGHYNFLFLEDINKIEIDKKNYIQAFKDAKKQGAFIQWNHPPYKQKTKDQWEAPQQRLLEEGLLDGIEIVGHTNLFTKAMQWADQYQLTITSSSDIHYLIDTKHEFYHRPITLIFAKENTVESIKEALFQKRSIAYYKDQLIGDEKFTEAIFNTSIKAEYFDCSTDKKSKTFALSNTSDIPYKLTLIEATRQYKYPKEIYIPPHKSVLNKIKIAKDVLDCQEQKQAIYQVENIMDLNMKKLQVAF